MCPGDNKIADIKNKLMPALQSGSSIPVLEEDWMALFKSKDDFEVSVAKGVKKALAVDMGKEGAAVPQIRARVAEGIKRALGIDMGKKGEAVDQARARMQEAVDNVLKLEAAKGEGPVHEIFRQVLDEREQ